MPVMFSKPRYISPSGIQLGSRNLTSRFQYKAEVSEVSAGITTVIETVPGPMPNFIPWIITNPTSYSYYIG